MKKMLSYYTCSPLAKLGSSQRLNTISYRYYNIKIIICDFMSLFLSINSSVYSGSSIFSNNHFFI